MYVGRIVAIGRTKSGKLAALYRVSSRSFPNREAQMKENAVAIVPKQGSEGDVFKNPYIAYNCMKSVGDTVVATNGAQTDPIAEKISLGMPVRDAMATALLALDYEKDKYNTPRIAAAVTLGAEEGVLGVVRDDGIEVVTVPIESGTVHYVATYETNRVLPEQCGKFDAETAEQGAKFILGEGLFAEMTNPVTAVCALLVPEGPEIAVAQA